MPRGKQSKEGETNISANGYSYTRTKDKWRLTHHIIAEEKLGRPLKPNEETVRFVDGDKTNLAPANIVVLVKRQRSVARRLAVVEAKINELLAEKEDLEAQLAKGST